MHDIQSKDDIIEFVDHFYNEAKNDELIGPIFLGRIDESNWSIHMNRIYSFWNTVLFGELDYRGNPFSHHISLSLEKKHFDRWMLLLEQTLNLKFEGPKANEVLDRANKMRLVFESKLKMIKSNPGSKPIM